MRHAVHEEEGITRVELNLYGRFDAVERVIAAGAFGIVERWMNQVGLVRTGNRHRRSIAIPDVAERQQHVDLPTPELVVVKAELRADAPLVRARLHARGAASGPDVDERFVDEKSVVPTHEAPHVADPRRMVDQPFAGLTHFEDVVQVSHTVDRVAMNPSAPSIGLDIEIGIHDRVYFGEVIGVDGTLEHDVAAQVEEVFLHFGRSHR